MSYQFSASFDYLTVASELFDAVTGVITINSASARFTSPHGQGCSIPQNSHITKNLSSSFATLIVGAAVKFTAIPTAATDLFMVVQDSNTVQCGLSVTNTGALQFVRSSTTTIGSASSGGIIVAGVWNFIEMLVTISNTVGVVQAWLNGIQVINSSGVNNRSSANNSSNQIGLGEYNNNGTGSPFLFDDLYCFDTGGSVLNSVAGDSRFVVSMASASGSFAQFTPVGAPANWDCVNEIPPDDDTTYVADGTIGDRDSYDFESQTFTGNAIMVVPWVRARKDDAGAHTIELSLRNGGVDAFSSAISVPSSYSYQNGGAFVVNPNGGGAIDQTAFNAMEFGAEIVS